MSKRRRVEAEDDGCNLAEWVAVQALEAETRTVYWSAVEAEVSGRASEALLLYQSAEEKALVYTANKYYRLGQEGEDGRVLFNSGHTYPQVAEQAVVAVRSIFRSPPDMWHVFELRHVAPVPETPLHRDGAGRWPLMNHRLTPLITPRLAMPQLADLTNHQIGHGAPEAMCFVRSFTAAQTSAAAWVKPVPTTRCFIAVNLRNCFWTCFLGVPVGDTVRLCRIVNRGTAAERVELSVNPAHYYPVIPAINPTFPWGAFRSPLSAPVGIDPSDVAHNRICWPLLLCAIAMLGDWTRCHPLVEPRWPPYNPVFDFHNYTLLVAHQAFDRVIFNVIAHN